MYIHFIGIGGIGVSALAKYYLKKGHQITGSDLISSENTEALKKSGAKIFIGKHKGKNVSKDVDLVIYSPAIQKSNPELKKSKVKIMSYPQALGELTKKYFTIAVSGTHGKSTTAAMIGLLLTKAGFDPTVIVGTKLKEFGNSNCRIGRSKYLVIEADEHFASFLNYFPKIIVLTRIEADHLDYFKNFRNYKLAFRKFVSHLPKQGFLIANKDDKNIYNLFSTSTQNKVYYSLKEKEGKILKEILKIPGEHNVSNALAALAVARLLEIPDKISFKALSEYKGSWRRFEIEELKIKNCKLKIINDYAHHPTEIMVTLKAAREKFKDKKIWCIYQPHQYQRTYYLFQDFVKVFKNVLAKNWIQKLIITDIFEVSGREKTVIKKKVSSKKIAQEIKKLKNKMKNSILYIPTIKKAANYLRRNLKDEEVIIIMGAGDIYNLTNIFKNKKIY